MPVCPDEDAREIQRHLGEVVGEAADAFAAVDVELVAEGVEVAGDPFRRVDCDIGCGGARDGVDDRAARNGVAGDLS